jgi:NADH:ubiquinone oxidoreductase subunit 3 (subunit A)
MRALIQLILLITVIGIGFLLISFLNILAPSASTSVDTSSYSSTTIKSETNTTIVQSWCISNEASVLTTTDTVLYNLCWNYIFNYIIKIAITIGIAIAVILIKAVIKVVVIFLAKFQRYKSHTEQSKDITQNLLITYICTTVLITFLVIISLCSSKPKWLISPSKI